jgi:Ribonuclease G/E
MDFTPDTVPEEWTAEEILSDCQNLVMTWQRDRRNTDEEKASITIAKAKLQRANAERWTYERAEELWKTIRRQFRTSHLGHCADMEREADEANRAIRATIQKSRFGFASLCLSLLVVFCTAIVVTKPQFGVRWVALTSTLSLD